MAKKAVVYARVSTVEQEKEGYSIPAQLKLLHKYAASNGFEVESEYVDLQTAREPGRKNFERMLQDLKDAKNCRTIIVEKVDRLSRNYEDFILVKKLDLEIHFAKAGSVYSKEAKAQTKFSRTSSLRLRYSTATTCPRK